MRALAFSLLGVLLVTPAPAQVCFESRELEAPMPCYEQTSHGKLVHLAFDTLPLGPLRDELAANGKRFVGPESGEWMEQLARNLTDMVDGFLTGKRYLILDRDPLCTRAFRRLLRESGVHPMLLPASSPNLNAYAERLVLSIKSECLDDLVLLSEEQLRSAVTEYVEHYHVERHHQGLGGALPVPAERERPGTGPVVCRESLGGLLKSSYCEGA